MLPSSLQKFILGIFTLQKLTFCLTMPSENVIYTGWVGMFQTCLTLSAAEPVMRHVGYRVALHF